MVSGGEVVQAAGELGLENTGTRLAGVLHGRNMNEEDEMR